MTSSLNLKTRQSFDPVNRGIDPHTAPEVSVVIPCLNEASSIGACIDKAKDALERLGVGYEIVVADNGSTDGSSEIAQVHGAHVVSAPIKGYGGAIRSGIGAARGDFIILGDADGSHDFGEIGLFLAKLRQGYDFVLGSRLLGDITEHA